MKKKWTARRVRDLRLRLGLSQTAFGELLGLSLRTVQAIELRERPITRTQSLAVSFVAISIEQEGADG